MATAKASAGAPAGSFLVAVTSFALQTGEQEDGTPIMQIVLAGSTIAADDPIVAGRENLFAPAGSQST